MKVSRILLYYSLTVTACLILAFILFISSITVPESNLPTYLFMMNMNKVTMLIQNGSFGGMSFLDLKPSIINKRNLEDYYVGALLQHIPILILCLVGILVTGTWVLSKILKVQHEKQALLLAKQLSSMDEEHIIMEQHPAIVKAYQEIKNKFEAYTLDYVRLSAYVTHEQKNILSLLRAKLQLSDHGELTEEVDKVTDSLDDILTLSASKENTTMELVDTALLCANVCDEYRRLHPNIHFDFDDDANNTIIGRELWISRAVTNLVSNAVKYGGNSEIHVSVSNRKGSVIIAVSDGGEGIDEAEQEKLFDYQYRVGKLKKDGYGIGLSLVRHVCELCDGLCWVENRGARGTTFYMIFPEALTLD